MSRTRVRRRRVVAVLAVVAIILPITRAAVAGSADQATTVEMDRYVVQQGDSLWAIAEGNHVADDPRTGVQILLRFNPQAASLQPGMALRIPLN